MEDAGRTAAAKAAIRAIRARPNVLVAIGNRILANSFDRWLAERPGIGEHVQWVHTKFMLIDPLSRTPTVITGSANFSEASTSTSTNNENMLVIRGDRRVADIYLGEFLRVYSHYAFREAVAIARARHQTSFQPQHLAADDRAAGVLHARQRPPPAPALLRHRPPLSSPARPGASQPSVTRGA